MDPNVIEEMQSESMPTPDLSGSQSVDRALRLLALVGRESASGLPLSEIVGESGLNKPTVRRLLLALMRAGLVEQDARTRRYHLGEETFVLGLLCGQRHGLLDLAMPSLRALSDTTQDTSFFSIRRDRFAICLHREEGTWPVRTHALQAGDQHPLGVGAGSLAMLALMPDAESTAMIEANRAVLAARYPAYSPAQLITDIALARQQGFALNPGRIVTNSWGIGVGVRYPDGRVAGALSIAAIDSRMQPQRQDELGALLRHEARQVETRIVDMLGRRQAKPATAEIRIVETTP
ncbi:DNA-binding transcriptional regulator, IclR family [Bosea lupini]|uniref:DNA-binding transcriptional regulator, IclR family n=1 Tax=Bosea lupini TaxID=1036779 RepID=A0A1H7MBT2_9HYPH|nr:IclR family transcriptional regulator [Bosea lupini]SEL08622.1 DNA-binding transcriptional regulator, IclR family [Bosea lupini]